MVASNSTSAAAGTPRRFAPVPMETSTRSSKKRSENTERAKSPMFINEDKKLDETQQDGTSAPRSRHFLPEPVETSTTSSRRKLPEPIETSAKSARGQDRGASKDASSDQPQRRFLPQPVESTERRRGNRRNSHKGEIDVDSDDVNAVKGKMADRAPDAVQSGRRFAPEPVETTARRRGGQRQVSYRSSDEEDEEMPDVPSRQSSTASTRRFSPELVETVRGSYRQRRTPGSTSPEYGKSPTADTFVQHSPQRCPITPKVSVAAIHDSRFSAANIAKRTQPEKQHSFIVPDLQTIPSDSSGESAPESSTATSPTTLSADGKSHRQRTSDEQVEGRLLELAARVAERQLREQLMAGFPTEHDHQPVQHYALEDEDDYITRPGHFLAHGNIPYERFRRDSAADLDLELNKMRRHQAQLKRAEHDLKEKAEATGESKFSAAALAVKKGIDLDKKEESNKNAGQMQKGAGMAQMRNAASPPMLGSDIKFPLSLSPKHTRCDVDQAPVPRRQESDDDQVMEDAHLWTATINIENDKDSGLWMGTCAKTSTAGTPHPDHFRRSGLMTPAFEIEDPMNMVHAKDQLLGMHQLPLTPATSHSDPSMDNIDKMLRLEEQIEEEFNDAFVTQIYNYISLGYPSLAHDFDYELSKISRISVEELRKDDERTDAKGYVGAPEGSGIPEKDMVEGKCSRWVALRVYIHEWARQRPEMIERFPSDWGARVRKGSWAI